MAGKVYKLSISSGATIDVEETSLSRAILGARMKGGEVWLTSTQITSGTFVVNLEEAKVFADVTVTGVLAFSPSTLMQPYRYSMIAVVADGTNIPTFTGFTKWGGSVDYVNTASKINYIMFFSDGLIPYYSIVPAA